MGPMCIFVKFVSVWREEGKMGYETSDLECVQSSRAF
jgi:hypothetical protein